MESQGDSNAGWLRQFAGGLAQALGLVAEEPTGSSSGDVRGFLVEIVQLIAQTQADPTQMYAFFRVNLSRLDQALLVRTQSAMPIEWATTTMNLATAYSERIKGDRTSGSVWIGW
ncbi:MAG: hypothetical protein HC857_13000 [Synechococcales cyanobacterium RU_4_20]|nr:hypothetical protein [Synechococcales cyanobacterium RU_4_20]NJR67849.1 hypothetical protein [Synechococcales cyanobacterium CRU_2_2]